MDTHGSHMVDGRILPQVCLGWGDPGDTPFILVVKPSSSPQRSASCILLQLLGAPDAAEAAETRPNCRTRMKLAHAGHDSDVFTTEWHFKSTVATCCNTCGSSYNFSDFGAHTRLFVQFL